MSELTLLVAAEVSEVQVANTLATVTVFVVGALMVLAVAHKVFLLVEGRAGQDPAFAWVRFTALRSSAVVVGVLAGIEAVIVTLLFLAPVVGLFASAVLMLTYGAVLRARQPDVECGCFGSALPMTNRAAAWRNFGLAVAAIASAIVATLRAIHPLNPTQLSVGLALLVLGSIGGYARAAALFASKPQQLDEFGR